jgi:hypothetical protein
MNSITNPLVATSKNINSVVNKSVSSSDKTIKKLKVKVMYAILIATFCVIGLVIIYQKMNVFDTLLRTYEGKSGDKGHSGSQGDRGKQGSKGDAGGDFTNQGSLMNLDPDSISKKRNFLNRSAVDSSNKSIGYLDAKQYDTTQYWTLLSNGQLENKYGDGTGQNKFCLETTSTDDGTDNIYLKRCLDSNAVKPKQKWRWLSDGTLRNDTHTNKCLSISKNKVDVGSNQKSNTLTLESCKLINSNPKNKWLFT